MGLTAMRRRKVGNQDLSAAQKKRAGVKSDPVSEEPVVTEPVVTEPKPPKKDKGKTRGFFGGSNR